MVDRVQRLSNVQNSVLVMWGQSDAVIENQISEFRRRKEIDRERRLETMFSAKKAGLTREEVIAHIIVEMYSDDPEPAPRETAELPKVEYVAEFPVAWIKPRNLGYDADISMHDERAYRGLEASIKRFGFTEHIVLNPDYSVADGQMRYEVAQMMGIAAVPVTILEEFSWAYGIYAGQIHRWSRWDHSITDLKVIRYTEKWPELGEELRELGWFVNDVPTHLTAPSLTLESVAKQILLKDRSAIYTFKPTDLLFIEPTRLELIHFWEAAGTEEYAELAKRARANHWDLGGFKNVGSEEVLDAAVMDVLNFIAFNLKRVKAEEE